MCLLRFMHIIFELQYVLEELNVKSLVPCNDTLKYASLRAEPDFRYCICRIYFLRSRCCTAWKIGISTLFFLTIFTS